MRLIFLFQIYAYLYRATSSKNIDMSLTYLAQGLPLVQ